MQLDPKDRLTIIRVNRTGYGCVQCQRVHQTDDPLYQDHLYWQDKHGVTTWTETTCVVNEVLIVPACEVLPAGEY